MERWSQRRRYERDWRAIGWLIADTDVVLPFLFLMPGAPPCAVLPLDYRGEVREFVLCGMMIFIAEVYPEVPNPVSVIAPPARRSDLHLLPPPFDIDEFPDDDEGEDRIVDVGRPR